jgi:hypothetical protein
VRGPYNYFPESEEAPPLLALLMAGGVFEMAEGLAGPGTLEVPWQIQVALNIPPFPHIPGLPHIDGAPAEPDGRPGTFTMLVGVLTSVIQSLSRDLGGDQEKVHLTCKDLSV